MDPEARRAYYLSIDHKSGHHTNSPRTDCPDCQSTTGLREQGDRQMDLVDLDKISDSDIRRAVADYLADVDEYGIIRAPGKFELEPLWTVYFYQYMLNGDGEDHYVNCEHVTSPCYVECDCESDLEYTSFTIDATDGEIFPVLEFAHGEEMRVREDSQGFVYAWIVESAS